MKAKYLSQSRREFVSRGIAGLSGLAFLPVLGQARRQSAAAEIETRPVPYPKRTLGRTGLQPTIVGVGGSGPDVTQKALELGLNYFDTANNYAFGRHEGMLGMILKSRPRDSLILATKILGLRDNRTGLPPKTLSASEFQADFQRRMDECLKRLQLEYVDILFLHGVDNVQLLDEAMVRESMQKLKRDGKARFLGVSFHHKEPELIPAVVKQGIYDVILTAYNFRQPHREEVGKAIAAAAQAGLGVVAMKIMAGAFWDRERTQPINGAAALKWVLHNESVHTTIPSSDNFNQLQLNVSVMEHLALTPQEENDLRAGEKLGLTGLYCGQCGRCRRDCRFHLDIPTAMRAFMYLRGYRKPLLARQTLDYEAKGDIRCRQCPTCAVDCVMGFNVKEKMADIGRLESAFVDFLV